MIKSLLIKTKFENVDMQLEILEKGDIRKIR